MKVEKLLPGVEVKFFQGYTGDWNCHVLLDPAVWGDDVERLPRRGNRPRRSTGRGSPWWYDLTTSAWVSKGETQTLAEARLQLDREVSLLLQELIASRLAAKVDRWVAQHAHRENSRVPSESALPFTPAPPRGRRIRIPYSPEGDHL